MNFKTSIPAGPGESTPDAGTKQPAGKSSEPGAVLRKGLLPKSESVREAVEVTGAARRAIDTQVRGDGGSNSPNGDPHRRNKATWGVTEPHPEN